jgi:tripartite-type tricarboxylate transporter receptor subunit TctC
MLRKLCPSTVRWFAITIALYGTFAAAQTAPFPSKSIRFLVPFSAGGTTDVLGRLVAQRLSVIYGQQVVVENRTGAGGHIGAEMVVRAPADGYTLLIGTIGIHAAHGIYTKLPYDPAKDLQPVILLAEVPLVMLVHPSLPPRNVKEFVALAKARPGEINFGSAGFGSSTHMTGALFEMMAQVKLAHVPYKGSAPALSDLVGGQIQAMFEVISPALPHHIATGKLRALGVTTKGRLPVLQDVPTVAEAGVPGYESTAWYTVAAPSKVPAAIIQKLNADINGVIGAPDMQPRFAELGATRMGGTPEAAAKYFAAETDKWNKVIKTAGIRAD